MDPVQELDIPSLVGQVLEKRPMRFHQLGGGCEPEPSVLRYVVIGAVGVCCEDAVPEPPYPRGDLVTKLFIGREDIETDVIADIAIEIPKVWVDHERNRGTKTSLRIGKKCGYANCDSSDRPARSQDGGKELVRAPSCFDLLFHPELKCMKSRPHGRWCLALRPSPRIDDSIAEESAFAYRKAQEAAVRAELGVAA
jgi:hypothetical protein